MQEEVVQESEVGDDESDEIESQEAETGIESRDGASRGRLISEGGVINSIIITRSNLLHVGFMGQKGFRGKYP